MTYEELIEIYRKYATEEDLEILNRQGNTFFDNNIRISEPYALEMFVYKINNARCGYNIIEILEELEEVRAKRDVDILYLQEQITEIQKVINRLQQLQEDNKVVDDVLEKIINEKKTTLNDDKYIYFIKIDKGDFTPIMYYLELTRKNIETGVEQEMFRLEMIKGKDKKDIPELLDKYIKKYGVKKIQDPYYSLNMKNRVKYEILE